MKASKDFSDGHLWYSVISRPPSSTFTRVQRVSCCFSLLLCTMLTSLMFYGIPSDPSEQTMDLGTAFIHYILYSVKKKRKRKQRCNDILPVCQHFSTFSLQKSTGWGFFVAFLEMCLMNAIRLLLILGDGQNCMQICSVMHFCFSAFYRPFWVYLAAVHDWSSEFTHHVSH